MHPRIVAHPTSTSPCLEPTQSERKHPPNAQECINITLFNHLGQLALEHVNYIVWGQIIISICYSYIQVETWKFGWSYNPGLLTKIIIHLGTIHKEYCSSMHYSWSHYFMTIPTQFSIFIIFMPSLSIPMSVSSYHLKFLP